MLANLFAIALLIALSAFFSGTEIAFASASEIRMRRAAETGGKREKTSYWILQRYDDALTAILIGNNLVNMGASSIATMVVMSLLGGSYAWVATIVMTVLLLTFGEILPKVTAKQRPEAFAATVALPVRGWMYLMHPLVVVVRKFISLLSHLWKDKAQQATGVTEDDLEVFFDTAEDEGAIDENTSDLLQSALEFDDVMAYEIITPRVDMVAIDVADDPQDILRQALASPYTRIPVYEDSKDNIIGVLHLNRYLKRMALGDSGENFRNELMPVCFVPKTTPLPAVLSAMRQRGCHLVVVSDEFGGTLGILTMEDVLEELVGDIWDETDDIDNAIALLPDGHYEASGDMRVHDFFEALEIDDRSFDAESTTLGGWAMEVVGNYPKVGDRFTYDGLEITVEKMHKRRVGRLSIRRLSPDVAAEG